MGVSDIICKLLTIKKFFMQTSLDVKTAAEEVTENAPTIMVKEQLRGKNIQTFLIAEKLCITKVPVNRAPLYLLAAFHVYNLEYPRGLTSLYTLLEVILLNTRPKKFASDCINNPQHTRSFGLDSIIRHKLINVLYQMV